MGRSAPTRHPLHPARPSPRRHPDQPDCRALRLLESLGVPLDALHSTPDAAPSQEETAVDVPHYSRESLALFAEAIAEAEFAGDRAVGTEHLLLALARCPNSTLTDRLQALGADFALLRERLAAMKRVEGGGRFRAHVERLSPKVDSPVGVQLASATLALQAVGAITCFPLTWPVALSGGGAAWQGASVAALTVWLFVSGLVLGTTLVNRWRWTWAPAAATLTVRSAACGAGGVYLAAQALRSDPALPVGLLALAVLCLLISLSTIAVARGLFEAAGWFGVEPRRRWITLRREGWWALLLAGLAEGAFLTVLVVLWWSAEGGGE